MPRIHCSVCGADSDQPGAPAVAPRFAPDLDTRPGEPLRSTLSTWMQYCPGCGYAAPDLGYAAAGVAELIRAEEYSRLENSFEKHSFLLEKLGHLADSGWIALQAAWQHDDRNRPEAAARCRRRAMRLWQASKAAGQDFLDTPAEEFALAVDVLRRMGEFEAAAETIRVALEDEEMPPVVDDILRFQMALIQQRDTARHTLDELPRQPESGTRVKLT